MIQLGGDRRHPEVLRMQIEQVIPQMVRTIV